MRRRRIANVRHRWPTSSRWRRHAPAHRDKLGAVVGVADHRSRVIREYARHRWQIANVTIDHAEEGDDGGLVGGDAVEIAHYRQASFWAAVYSAPSTRGRRFRLTIGTLKDALPAICKGLRHDRLIEGTSDDEPFPEFTGRIILGVVPVIPAADCNFVRAARREHSECAVSDCRPVSFCGQRIGCVCEIGDLAFPCVLSCVCAQCVNSLAIVTP